MIPTKLTSTKVNSTKNTATKVNSTKNPATRVISTQNPATMVKSTQAKTSVTQVISRTNQPQIRFLPAATHSCKCHQLPYLKSR